MPVVKGKHFAYTKAGKKAAKMYVKKEKAKKTLKSMMMKSKSY